MMRFRVEGMTCGGCARAVTDAVKGVDASAEVTTDVPGRTERVKVFCPKVFIKVSPRVTETVI